MIKLATILAHVKWAHRLVLVLLPLENSVLVDLRGSSVECLGRVDLNLALVAGLNLLTVLFYFSRSPVYLVESLIVHETSTIHSFIGATVEANVKAELFVVSFFQ